MLNTFAIQKFNFNLFLKETCSCFPEMLSMIIDIVYQLSSWNYTTTLVFVWQGMSDFLAPILYVMEDESESFWCFASLMEHLGANFNRDQNGMHAQLLALSKVYMPMCRVSS